MDGVADNPWPWFACGFGAFLFAAWFAQRTGDRKGLLAAVGLLALALAPLLLAAFRDTPRKQIGRALEALRAAGERRDPDALLREVSANFAAGGYDRKGLEAVVRREFQAYHPNFVSFGTPEIALDGDAAKALLEISTGGDYRGGGLGQVSVPLYRMRFELAFRKEGAAWKLSGAKRFEWKGEPPAEIPLDAKR